MDKQCNGILLVIIGVLIFFMPFLSVIALGYIPIEEFWRIQVMPGVPLYYILAGIPVLIGLLLLARGSDEYRKEEISRSIKRGVCAECGSSLGGYKVGCNRCTKVFCSDACARRHYLNYHS
ncbi:hypothetical protein EU527_17780 [Candidatus Thorarchaeota archaeon]|nr:MAG: hypothetical protein EU527_17780 [Candidatus Thorarchaeota archaeon]